MSSNIVFGFIITTSLAFFGGMYLIVSSWDIPNLKDSLENCQKDLPRSQRCELIAVVKEKK
ncbi:MAG: hypothetical protein EOO06_00955 [Chitinophagaceae bacterium]|nr:MAG: hypothetical protein EOO06_00955 [Chitinophagaceae bacterium]